MAVLYWGQATPGLPFLLRGGGFTVMSRVHGTLLTMRAQNRKELVPEEAAPHGHDLLRELVVNRARGPELRRSAGGASGSAVGPEVAHARRAEYVAQLE